MFLIAGYDHMHQTKMINLNAVRLCFQAQLKVIDANGVEKREMLAPVVSDPIYDKKSNTQLTLLDISDTTSPLTGGKKIMLFCEKVNKNDIAVRFFEKNAEGDDIWESIVNNKVVHRQIGMSFLTPQYRILNMKAPVKVFMQLYRPSDRACSEPMDFEYEPLAEGKMKTLFCVLNTH